MNSKKRKYCLLIGRPGYDYRLDKETSFDGNYEDYERIFSDEVVRLHEIAKLLNITTYKIERDSWNSNIIFQTPDITAFYEFTKNKKDEFEQKQRNKVERINALPKIFPLTVTGAKNSYYVKRGIATYDPSYSREISVNVSAYCGDHQLFPEEYFTRDGKTLKKQIYTNSKWILGDDHLTVDPVYVVQMLKDKVVEVRKKILVL
jgi:hypothetical protein